MIVFAREAGGKTHEVGLLPFARVAMKVAAMCITPALWRLRFPVFVL